MRQRRVSLDVLDFSLLIIDQYPNNNNNNNNTLWRQFQTGFTAHVEVPTAYSCRYVRLPDLLAVVPQRKELYFLCA